MKRVVFVCTGNTCRSPMAQAIAQGFLDSRDITGWEVFSAGLTTVDGLPASPEAVKTMLDAGFDLSGHKSRQLDNDLIFSADYIITMTAAQCAYLKNEYRDKAISSINEFLNRADRDIVDPYGGGFSAYERCARELNELIPEMLGRLLEIEEDKYAGVKAVAIGSDHAGFRLKSRIIEILTGEGYKVLDCGTYSEESVDYPDIAEKVAAEVLVRGIKGIVICGTGVGITVAANKIPGIRAALCYNLETARLAREHNDANVVAVGARMLDEGSAVDMVRVFLTTEFEAGRHQRRIDKITALEKKFFGRSRQGGLY